MSDHGPSIYFSREGWQQLKKQQGSDFAQNPAELLQPGPPVAPLSQIMLHQGVRNDGDPFHRQCRNVGDRK